MKHFQPILFCLAISLGSCNIKNPGENDAAAQQQVQPPQCKYAILDSLDERVKFEKIPATNVIALSFSGNYQRHPQAYEQLKQYADKNYANTGGVIGIYPQDPDLVDEANLTWEINLRVLPGKPGNIKVSSANPEDPFEINIPESDLSAPLSELKAPEKPYLLKTLPATDAITLVSDVAHIGQDGLAINAWIDLNNYAQTSTTRTEFGSPDQKSMLIPVKIIVPVKKRMKETINLK